MGIKKKKVEDKNLKDTFQLAASKYEQRRKETSGQPADDVQHHDEVIILEAGHVCTQDVGLDLQLDILYQ